MPDRVAGVRSYNRDFRVQAAALDWVEDIVLVPEAAACGRCGEVAGTYAADAAPVMPVRGCEKKNGCRCWLAVAFPPQRADRSSAA